MGKSVNYLREYKEIEVLEKRRKRYCSFSGAIFITFFLSTYFSSLSDLTFAGIFAPFLLVHVALNFFSYRKIKIKMKELGFESLDDFRECIDGASECLEIRGVPDELITDEQNRIIGDFVKGKKERKWKDVPEMFKGGGISVAPPTKFKLNGIIEAALSEDDEED